MIELLSHEQAYFASDLHLSAATPRTLEIFERWMATTATPSAHIFLLGDVFEVWVGDDYTDEVTARFVRCVNSAKQCGAKVYFMAGNRDFLLGEDFAQECEMDLLPDPEFIRVGQSVLLLTHGDQFCTDDLAYQKFRIMSRAESWQTEFLNQPLPKRLEIAKHIRGESDKNKSMKTADIMDVNLSAVQSAFQGRWPDGHYAGRCNAIIHGHTHRCAVHLEAENRNGTCSESQTGVLQDGIRLVLPDWNFEERAAGVARGGFLQMNHTGQFELTVFH